MKEQSETPASAGLVSTPSSADDDCIIMEMLEALWITLLWVVCALAVIAIVLAGVVAALKFKSRPKQNHQDNRTE